VVRELAHRADLLEAFASAATELTAQGVRLVTTTAGFFALYQRELQARVAGAVVLTSGLLQVPWLASLLAPGRRVGILTMEARSLTADHLRACGIDAATPIAVQGLETVGGYSNSVFVGDASELDRARVEAEHVEAARLLCSRHPDVAVIVLQSNAMPPYAAAIARATGLPVYDLVTLVRWYYAGLHQMPFER
jgi:hypothetical protein